MSQTKHSAIDDSIGKTIAKTSSLPHVPPVSGFRSPINSKYTLTNPSLKRDNILAISMMYQVMP